MPLGNKKGAPPVHEALAENLGLHTIEQLLHHYPRRYLDRSAMVSLRELRIGQEATIIAAVKRVRQAYTRKRKSMVTVTVADGTGYLDLF